MATLKNFGPMTHLRAESNQYILHHRKGKLVREGAGLAYWFNPLSAALAEVPVEDLETTFLLKERTRDLQEVAVQLTLRFRIEEPRRAARRFNFGISFITGRWAEEPLERLAALWAQRSQVPAREYLASVDLEEAIRRGAGVIRDAIEKSLRDDDALEEMGLVVGSVQVIQVAPSAELEKALGTPTREALQQRADEAVFLRRAQAVEKERAIQENELATEIELARRQEKLIEREGENELLEAELTAKSERARIEAELERDGLIATAYARNEEARAEGDAAATRARAEATAAGEALRVEVWGEASGKVLLGLALQEFASKIDHIQHLSVSPELFGDGLKQFLLTEAGR
jgi:regulator of protease activity HflC (stomatin/prohibitin superfamily)